jgi:hypothetical protein
MEKIHDTQGPNLGVVVPPRKVGKEVERPTIAYQFRVGTDQKSGEPASLEMMRRLETYEHQKVGSVVASHVGSSKQEMSS